MKFWPIFLFILVFKVFLLSFGSYVPDLPEPYLDMGASDLIYNSSELEAQTSENQYLEQSIAFKNMFKNDIISNLLLITVTPLGSFIETLIPYDIFPSLLITLLNFIYMFLATISIFEFFRGFNIL